MAEKRITTSRLTVHEHTKAAREMLEGWCHKVAAAGGTFSITALYEQQFGHTVTYVIEWPDSMESIGASSGRQG